MQEADVRRWIAATGRLMYERYLTDSAGGNISVRALGKVFATPRYAGSKHRWQLAPEQIIALEKGQVAPEQTGVVSREIQMHLAVYEYLPLAQAVIHAHARYVMPFVTLGKPLPPVWEDTEKFGTIGFVPAMPAHSSDLAEQVARHLATQAEAMTKHALAVMIPKHGIVVAGRDLDDAYDTLERLNGNAECILLCQLLAQAP